MNACRTLELYMCACREGNDPADSRSITYAELLDEVVAFARVLKSKGKLVLVLRCELVLVQVCAVATAWPSICQ